MKGDEALHRQGEPPFRLDAWNSRGSIELNAFSAQEICQHKLTSGVHKGGEGSIELNASSDRIHLEIIVPKPAMCEVVQDILNLKTFGPQ